MAKTKSRGFEPVIDSKKEYTQHVKIPQQNKTLVVYEETVLPTRSDNRSAGYDFYAPIDIKLLPMQKTILWTNVKAYMNEDEMLQIYPRSSMGIKAGLMLSNTVGIIDSSYYGNESNDGNIGLALLNTSGKSIDIKRGDRIAQGIFTKYLIADEDEVTGAVRTGGMGSSGK